MSGPRDAPSLEGALYRIAQGVSDPAGAAWLALEAHGRPTPPSINDAPSQPAPAPVALRERVRDPRDVIVDLAERVARHIIDGAPVAERHNTEDALVKAVARYALTPSATGEPSGEIILTCECGDVIRTVRQPVVCGNCGREVFDFRRPSDAAGRTPDAWLILDENGREHDVRLAYPEHHGHKGHTIHALYRSPATRPVEPSATFPPVTGAYFSGEPSAARPVAPEPFNPSIHLPGEYEIGRLIREAADYDPDNGRMYLTCSVGELAQRICTARPVEEAATAIDCGTYLRNWMQPENRFRVTAVDIAKKEQPWRMTVYCVLDGVEEAEPREPEVET